MIHKIRHGVEPPELDNLSEYQLGFCDKDNSLYIRKPTDYNDGIILKLAQGIPKDYISSGIIMTDSYGFHQNGPRFFELASLKINRKYINGVIQEPEHLSFKFDCAYFHNYVMDDGYSLKNETVIGTSFCSLNFKEEKKSTNIYGAVTNLIDNELHLCMNYIQDMNDEEYYIKLYFMTERCRESYCKISNIEILNERQVSVDIKYIKNNLNEPGTDHLSSPPLKQEFQFRFKPNNG